MSSRDQRAFTLMELVVVIALAAIMLVVAIPRLDSGWISGGGDETARWIIATAHHLKERSVMDQTPGFLHVSMDGRQMWTSVSNPADSESGIREKRYTLPQGVSIDQVEFSSTNAISTGTAVIAFYPKGYSDKATIWIRDHEGDQMRLFIEPFLFRVRMDRNPNG